MTEMFVTHAIIAAFVKGVVEADRHYWGYETPDNLHLVVRQLSHAIEARYGNAEILHATIDEVKQIVRDVVMSSEECRGWNARPGRSVITRWSQAADAPEFIDLDAIILNTRSNLKNHVNS